MGTSDADFDGGSGADAAFRAGASSGARIAFAVLAGCAIDFGLGVFLHARVEHLENTQAHTYYTGLGVKAGQFQVGMFGPDSVGHISWRNWFNILQPILGREWLAAAEQYHPGDPRLEESRAALHSAMAEKLTEDDRFWYGWFARHGGEVVYLGDWFGDTDVTSVLLALAAAGLLWRMANSCRRICVVVETGKAKPGPSKRKR